MALRGISGRTFFFNRPQGKKPCGLNQGSASTTAIRRDAIGYGRDSSNPGDSVRRDMADGPNTPDADANGRRPYTNRLQSKPSQKLALAQRMLPDNLNSRSRNHSRDQSMPHSP
jgi:hypothetical protein